MKKIAQIYFVFTATVFNLFWITQVQAVCDPVEISKNVSAACHVIRYLQSDSGKHSFTLEQQRALIGEVRGPIDACLSSGDQTPVLKNSAKWLNHLNSVQVVPCEGSGCRRSDPATVVAAAVVSLENAVDPALQVAGGGGAARRFGSDAASRMNSDDGGGDPQAAELSKSGGVVSWAGFAASRSSLGVASIGALCPGVESPGDWVRWAHSTVLKKLAMTEADPDSRAREIVALLNASPPNPLMTALAGSSLPKLKALSGVLAIPGFSGTSYWNSWAKLTLESFGSLWSDEDFNERVHFFTEKVRGKTPGTLAQEPLVLLPVSKDTIASIVRGRVDVEKARLSGERRYLDCLEAAAKKATQEAKKERKVCFETLVQPKIEEVEKNTKGQREVIAELLYRQVRPASERGFPYGFESREQFEQQSRHFLAEIREGVEQAHREAKPAERLAPTPKGSIYARFAGSSAAGLSFSPKGQGDLRTAFHRGSDFDIAIYLPETSYNWVLERSAHQIHANPGKKIALRKGAPFPVGVDEKGQAVGSAYCEDQGVAKAILEELKILRPLQEMAKLKGRDVNIMFKKAGDRDLEYEEAVAAPVAASGGGVSLAKPPSILITEN
jgi:hypothetical protein